MRIEDYNNYELNVKHTIIANIIYIFFMCIVFYFIYFSFKFIINIPDENGQIIALIVFMFITMRLFGMIGIPDLQYKPRALPDENKTTKGKKENEKKEI